MTRIRVELGEHAYDIHIDSDLSAQAADIRECVTGNGVMIVTNETVAPLYLARTKDIFEGMKVDTHILPDGESYKTLASYELIIRDLLATRHNRNTTLVALGGGVVGDITGFVAATYQRGVNFIQMPTTLLAQVDSSVGGKTAVNHPLGKNMIGAFYQPGGVFIDTSTLSTLPARELSAGLAEVIKHGALADVDYFDWIEANIGALMAQDSVAMAHAVARSCEIKSEIVADDERETGRRALLNLGHTFGHALEQTLGYGVWLHGEAVGTGLVMAADLSVRLGRLDIYSGLRIRKLVAAAGLPVAPPQISAESLLEAMAIDKKATDQGIRFVLLNGIGDAAMVANVDRAMLMATLGAGQRLLAS